MRDPAPNLTRFVRRVRWRLIAVGAAERAGIGIGVASVVACVFACVALVRERDAVGLVLPIVVSGAVVGLCWGLARRATSFDAAAAADERLKLSDLLATAHAALRGHDDEWGRTVVALADARCRELSPADVVVPRFGGRAWGGIGLAAALSVTLGLLSAVPRDTRALAAADATASRESVAAAAAEDGPLVNRPDSRGRENAADSSDGSRAGGAGDAGSDSAQATADASAGRFGAGASDGTESSQTDRSEGAVPRGNSNDARAEERGDAVAGGGSTSVPGGRSPGSRASVGASAGSGSSTLQTPPWKSGASWDAARDAAHAAVRDGRVPDAYRDVVREYFRPESR
jgi:hypothetical protein